MWLRTKTTPNPKTFTRGNFRPTPAVKQAHMHRFLQDLRFGTRTLTKTPRVYLGRHPRAGGRHRGQQCDVHSRDRNKAGTYRAFACANYVDIRNGNNMFASLMAHTFAMVGVPAGGGTRQTFIEVVSSNYFDTLGVPLEAGRAFSPDEERPASRIPVAIVNHQHRDLLGKTVKVNSLDFTVVGSRHAILPGRWR